MSTEIYGSRFNGGQPVSLATTRIRGAFATLIVATEPRAWMLEVGGAQRTSVALYLDVGADAVSSFVLARPVDDDRLYAGLLDLLKESGTVVYAPGSAPVAAHPDTARQLPPELVAALGPVVQVGSARALRDALFGAPCGAPSSAQSSAQSDAGLGSPRPDPAS